MERKVKRAVSAAKSAQKIILKTIWPATHPGAVFEKLNTMTDFYAYEIDPLHVRARKKIDEVKISQDLAKKRGSAKNCFTYYHTEMGAYLKKALKKYNSAIKYDPQNADYFFERGKIKTILGWGCEAIEDFANACQRNPQHEFAFFYKMKWIVLLDFPKKLRSDEIIEIVKKLDHLRSNEKFKEAEIDYLQAKLMQKCNRLKKAEVFPIHTISRRLMGVDYLAIADPLLRRHKEKTEYSLYADYAKTTGDVILLKKACEKAHSLLAEYDEFDKGHVMTPLSTASSPILGNHEAKEVWEFFALMNPDDLSSSFVEKKFTANILEKEIEKKFYACMVLQQSNVTEKVLETLIEWYSENPACWIGRGMVYLKQKKFHMALVDFNKALELDANNKQALQGLKLVKEEEKRTVEEHRKAAEQGDADAQCNLGYCYEAGRGVKQDYAEAFKLYQKAADQGHADAQCKLGYCYIFGRVIEQNYAEAVKLFRKAADQGYARAQCNLGYCDLPPSYRTPPLQI